MVVNKLTVFTEVYGVVRTSLVGGSCVCAVFKRVVARRAVYHTLNVITLRLYVCPSVCVTRDLAAGGGAVGPTLGKMVSEHH